MQTPYDPVPLQTDLNLVPPEVSRAHASALPATPIGTFERRLPRQPHGRLPTVAWFLLFLSTVFLAGLVDRVGGPAGVSGGLLCVSLALLAVSTIVAWHRALEGAIVLVGSLRGTRPSVTVASASLDTFGNLVVAGIGSLIGLAVAYLSTFGFSRGRQLRRWGRVLLPPVGRAPAWSASPTDLAGWDVPAAVAEQWRENGRTEHASVAAFARLTLDLMALGAPPSLIASANRDALDEIRHTEICFSLARAIDGADLGPGSFPAAQRVSTLPRSRTMALAKLAVDSLVDGALHEGVSARIIARLSERCEVPAIHSALKEVAADEGRHAAHGWAVVSWCLAEGGVPVASALLASVRALPKQMHSKRPDSASRGEWERFGIHGYVLEAEEYAAGLSHVVRRVKTLATAPAAGAA